MSYIVQGVPIKIPLMFDNNFDKYGLIFKIVSPVDSPVDCGVQSCTAIHRVPRRRMGERPLDIEVSCEISGFRPDE